MQHAHNRGILHRDLKPSNILVTDEDAQPVPKVIDFGVAKLFASDAKRAGRTLAGQLLGTLGYMSPEQTDQLHPDSDVRSDVYSLGVVLYELLTGVLPVPTEALSSLSVGNVRATITNHARVAPSRIDESASRGRRVRGGVPAEIDCLILKAADPDVAQRYASPSELAADIERFLSGRAIAARPPSMLYLSRKFIQRHQWPVALGAAIALGLVGGVVALSIGLSEAVAQRDRAQRAATVFEEVSRAIRTLMLTPRTGPNATHIEIVTRGANDFLASPPTSVPVRARVGFTLGQALHQSGDRQLVKRLLNQAINDLKSPEFDVENAPQRDSMLFTSYTMLAGIARGEGGDELAERLWGDALKLGRTLEGVSPSQLLAAASSYADVLAARGDLDKAERVIMEARDQATTSGANDRFVALLDGALCGVWARMGRFEEAVSLGERAFRTRATGKDQSRPFTVMIGLRYGRTLLMADRAAVAVPLLEEVRQMSSETSGPAHPDTAAAELLLILAHARSGAEPAAAIGAASQTVDRIQNSEGAVGARAIRARVYLVEILFAGNQEADASAVSDELIEDISGARGSGSREEAMVNWEIARAMARTRPLDALPRFEAAWAIFSKELGVSSTICRVITTEAAEAAQRSGSGESFEQWRSRLPLTR